MNNIVSWGDSNAPSHVKVIKMTQNIGPSPCALCVCASLHSTQQSSRHPCINLGARKALREIHKLSKAQTKDLIYTFWMCAAFSSSSWQNILWFSSQLHTEKYAFWPVGLCPRGHAFKSILFRDDLPSRDPFFCPNGEATLIVTSQFVSAFSTYGLEYRTVNEANGITVPQTHTMGYSF